MYVPAACETVPTSLCVVHAGIMPNNQTRNAQEAGRDCPIIVPPDCLLVYEARKSTNNNKKHAQISSTLSWRRNGCIFSAGTTPTPVRIVSLILSTARHAERQRRTLVRGNNYSRYPNSQAGGSFTSKQHQARRSSA